MKISDDINNISFLQVAEKRALRESLEGIYDDFHAAIRRAQRHFLRERRTVDVQNPTGGVTKCDVMLCDRDPDNFVNVWPSNEEISRERVAINRGKQSPPFPLS
jgi:hypothetical protein